MIRKMKSSLAGHIRVIFELPSSLWADKVYVLGEFNQWNPEGIPLLRKRNGVWQAMLDLPIGRTYAFRYLIDGQWKTDFHADGYSIGDTPDSFVSTELSPSALKENKPQQNERPSYTKTIVRNRHLGAKNCAPLKPIPPFRTRTTKEFPDHDHALASQLSLQTKGSDRVCKLQIHSEEK